MSDDAFLLRRYARERAEEAFAELVRRHLDGVYSAALRRVGGDTHLAEDVAQQVFVALARNAARLSDREILSGWLYTTTRHVAANVVRSERRRKSREQQSQFMSEALADDSANLDWERMAPLLDEAMDGLAEADRTAILLRFVERRAFGEIGVALRTSEDAARMRVERALDKLRGRLERRGIASTSAALGVALGNHAVAAAPAGFAATVTTTAGAATPTLVSTALNALEIMSTAKSMSLAAAVVTLIVALGTAIYEIRVRRDAEVTLAAEQQNHVAQLARLSETERRSRLAETDAARLQKAVDDARATQAATKARAAAEAEAAKKDVAWDGAAEGKAFFARHPEVKRAFDASNRALVKTRWAAFLATAHLSPDQTEEFLRLKIVGSATGVLAGPGGKMMYLAAGEDITPQEATNRLGALLGEEEFKRLVRFGAAVAARDFTERVASALVFSDAPLAPAQASELADDIAGARTKQGGSKNFVIDWSVVMERAQGFLAAPQLRALADVWAQNEAELATMRK